MQVFGIEFDLLPGQRLITQGSRRDLRRPAGYEGNFEAAFPDVVFAAAEAIKAIECMAGFTLVAPAFWPSA